MDKQEGSGGGVGRKTKERLKKHLNVSKKKNLEMERK